MVGSIVFSAFILQRHLDLSLDFTISPPAEPSRLAFKLTIEPLQRITPPFQFQNADLRQALDIILKQEDATLDSIGGVFKIDRK